MHPVANEVPVPTDALERELRPFVLKRFTGRVEVPIRVKPEAGLAVEVGPAKGMETQRIGDRPINIHASPYLFSPTAPTEGELVLRQLLAGNAFRFRIGMQLTGVICDLKEGRINAAQWVTVG